MTPTKTRPHKPMLAEWTSEILSLVALDRKNNLEQTPGIPRGCYMCTVGTCKFLAHRSKNSHDICTASHSEALCTDWMHSSSTDRWHASLLQCHDAKIVRNAPIARVKKCKQGLSYASALKKLPAIGAYACHHDAMQCPPCMHSNLKGN